MDVGTDAKKNVSASANIPIGEKSALRLLAGTVNQDGYVKNALGQNAALGRQDVKGSKAVAAAVATSGRLRDPSASKEEVTGGANISGDDGGSGSMDTDRDDDVVMYDALGFGPLDTGDEALPTSPSRLQPTPT